MGKKTVIAVAVGVVGVVATAGIAVFATAGLTAVVAVKVAKRFRGRGQSFNVADTCIQLRFLPASPFLTTTNLAVSVQTTLILQQDHNRNAYQQNTYVYDNPHRHRAQSVPEPPFFHKAASSIESHNQRNGDAFFADTNGSLQDGRIAI